MRGTILGYDQLAGEGVISGDDGQRAPFRGTEWKSTLSQLRVGATVDYEIADGVATTVYAVPGASSQSIEYSDEKSHLVAGLLALFFGPLGIHKFYMGYQREGVILLATTLISWVLVIVFIGIFGILATALISFIEAIIYLTAGQSQFRQTYLEGHKSWF